MGLWVGPERLVHDQDMESSMRAPACGTPMYDCTITGEWYYGYTRACQ